MTFASETSTPRRVLMVAFHFPPMAGSSGVQRTLRFVQHLPALGWQPAVLTAHPRVHPQTSNDLLAQIPAGTPVERAFALDTSKHLSIAGRYPAALARPDRWVSWALGAVPAGLAMIRRFKPDVIWSTYPIATAHLIAHRLHRVSGIPWVADFRDPMAQEGYPADPRTWASFKAIEERAARDAARLVFVTPSARAMYRDRYALGSERIALIENGYDEESFSAAEQDLGVEPLNPGCFTLLHSGIVYPSERDPRAMFAALGRLRASGRIGPDTLRLRFRAPTTTELLQGLARETRTEDIIEILPPVPYAQALQEMMRADGLLVMQGANCNEQVPAKLYEYFRACRPILGLADPVGDTARVMADAGVAPIAQLEDSAAVEAALLAYLDARRAGASRLALSAPFAAMSRRARAAELVDVLEHARAAR